MIFGCEHNWDYLLKKLNLVDVGNYDLANLHYGLKEEDRKISQKILVRLRIIDQPLQSPIIVPLYPENRTWDHCEIDFLRTDQGE